MSGSAFEASDLLAYSVGPVTLRSHLDFLAAYNDNVYYDAYGGQPQADFILIVDPNISVSLGREVVVNPWLDFFEEEGNFISLKGGAEYYQYFDLDDLTTLDPYANLKMRWKGNRISVKGNDDFTYISSPIGYGYNIREKVTRFELRDQYQLEYALTQKLRSYITGYHRTIDYEDGTRLYDQTNLKGTIGFGYQALARMSFFGEAFLGQTSVDPNISTWSAGPRSTSFGGFLGTQGKFTERLAGMLKLGYEAYEFSDTKSSRGEPLISTSLNYQFRERTTVALNYDRDNAVSVQSAGVAYVMDSIGVRLTQFIGAANRLGISLQGQVTFTDYSNSTGSYQGRQDNRYRLRLSANYLIKAWLRAQAGYSFEYFDINGVGEKLGLVDYTVNLVTIGLAVGLQ